MAFKVSIPSFRVSSCPVAIGNVKQSIKISQVRIPHLPVKSLTNLLDTLSFQSASRACPCSSIVSAITAAPCSTTKGIIFANLDNSPSPSSKLTELITDLPPSCSNPAFKTAGSVESNTIGNVEVVANLKASSFISATPSRPT